jgi:hypothetical protein
VTGQVGYAIPATAKKATLSGLDEDTGQPSFDVEHHPRFVSNR